ncbi:hypothetical protein [Aeoliella sp.]|uniref:hypothetical protein n=1 Tax=Aeoliella sp. TaxID=2795800 RepID=UPI003CCB8D1C
MRLTPAQVAIRLITGESLRMATRDMTKAQRIREGHRMLVRICHCDHGYDLLAWHKELRKSNAGGYNWGGREGIPDRIQNALDDSNWRETVAELKRVDAERMARRKPKNA